jgi:hypothetical protein
MNLEVCFEVLATGLHDLDQGRSPKGRWREVNGGQDVNRQLSGEVGEPRL